MTRRLGIDCRLTGTSHTGIGRYIVELVPRLINQGPRNYHWILYVFEPSQAQVLRRLILPERLEQVEFYLTPITHYSLKEQWFMDQRYRQDKLDLLHVPHFNKPLLYNKKTIITIHDLLWHKQKGSSVTTLSPFIYHLKYLMYRLVVRQAVLGASQILVPSNQTKKDLLVYWPKAKNRLNVIYEGVSLPQESQAPKKILPKDYLLYVGSLYPHKNIQVLLKALKRLPKKQLVIVSARNAFLAQTQDLLGKLNLTTRVIFLHQLKDSELRYLYEKAHVLVQPSIHEGFGLTGIEALSLGTPVVASDIPVFHEIYQDAVSYFPPTNDQKLAQLLTKEKVKLKKPLKTKRLLKNYSWEDCAHQTLKVYAKALKT